MLLVFALVAAPAFELMLEGCGDLLDEAAVQTAVARSVNVRLLAGRIICRDGRAFVQLKDRALPHGEVSNVRDVPETLRAQLVVQNLERLASMPQDTLDLPIEDLRELAFIPWSGSAKLDLSSLERQPISVYDRSGKPQVICETPCTLQTGPGALKFARGGHGSDYRLAAEWVAIGPGGGAVQMRSPTVGMFATASALMVLAAASDVFGMWGFFLTIGSYSSSFTVAAFITWMTSDFLLIPVSIALFAGARLGNSSIQPYGLGFKF